MWNRRSLLFLALAVFFGSGAALATRSYLAQQQPGPAPAPPRMVPVVTTTVELGVGMALRPSDLQTVEWPESHLPDGVIRDAANATGRVLRRAVGIGEPLFESALLPDGSSAGLPAVIGEDYRAVSVKVDAVVGVAGFVKPGARVDVLATLRRAGQPNFSNVILQDVRILAVDQTMEQLDDGKPDVVNVVTLEVDTEQAQRLVHAAHEGRLQLALRNPGDERLVETRAVGPQDLFGPAQRRPEKAPSGPSVEVIRGSSVGSVDL